MTEQRRSRPSRGDGARDGRPKRADGARDGRPKRADGARDARPGTVRETSRSIALAALVRADTGGFANVDVPVRLRRSRLDQRDKDWVTDAVYGTLRRRRVIDDLLRPLSARPLELLDTEVRAALRLGAYQLLNGVPAHAAVSETVAVVRPSGRKYVNGVLRALGRTGPPFPIAEDAGDAAALSYPDWIVEELTANFGPDDARRALEAMNEPPAVTLRVNPRRGDVASVLRELEVRGGSVEPGRLVPSALRISGFGDIGALRAVRDGRASPHDEGSQAIVAVLDPQPGEVILDVASAPGGKACAAAERMDDTGLVVAADVHAGRLRLVREAAGRLQLQSIQALVGAGDALPFTPGRFDRVLLDAPCSGLGVLRRRPEARWRVQPEQLPSLSALQIRLLAAAGDAVRVGGRLVYSVCTLSQAETIAVDEWAAEHLPWFVALDPPGAPFRPHGRGAVVLPHDAGSDGMFVLVLERRSADLFQTGGPDTVEPDPVEPE